MPVVRIQGTIPRCNVPCPSVIRWQKTRTKRVHASQQSHILASRALPLSHSRARVWAMIGRFGHCPIESYPAADAARREQLSARDAATLSSIRSLVSPALEKFFNFHWHLPFGSKKPDATSFKSGRTGTVESHDHDCRVARFGKQISFFR